MVPTTILYLPLTSLTLDGEPYAAESCIASVKRQILFTGLAYRLGRKQRPAIVPLSKSLGPSTHQTGLSITPRITLPKSLGPPAPQTSLSTNPRITSLDRVLIFRISQFLSSQTSSFFPSSFKSPQIRESLVIVHGSVFRIAWEPSITIISGCGFYDG